jgi:hypothetical protein
MFTDRPGGVEAKMDQLVLHSKRIFFGKENQFLFYMASLHNLWRLFTESSNKEDHVRL